MSKKKKPASKKNTAKKVETNANEPLTTERLAFNLNQNYTNLMQAKANITAINQELERREKQNAKVKE